jgi:UDP-N-acetylmuramoyl-tripeptide--D-alanyl-D-alanine ligase
VWVALKVTVAKPASITKAENRIHVRDNFSNLTDKESLYGGSFLFSYMTIPEIYQLFLQYPSVQTDTRKLKEGDLFFALKGEHFNGNTFAKKALEAGAAYAIIDEAEYKENDRMILVADVLTCLQQLALHHRRQFNIPVLAKQLLRN